MPILSQLDWASKKLVDSRYASLFHAYVRTSIVYSLSVIGATFRSVSVAIGHPQSALLQAQKNKQAKK